MRVINYRQNDIDGLGVMTDEKNFISLAEVAPKLPVTMMGLLNINGWQAEVHTSVQGKSSHLSIGDVHLLPLIPDTPVIWCVGVNYKEHQDETGPWCAKKSQCFSFVRIMV